MEVEQLRALGPQEELRAAYRSVLSLARAYNHNDHCVCLYCRTARQRLYDLSLSRQNEESVPACYGTGQVGNAASRAENDCDTCPYALPCHRLLGGD